MSDKAMIHEKIIAILADADAISKDRRNQQQGFNFRGIDDVYNALHPLLAKHGVFRTTEVTAERTEERQAKSGGNLIYRILTVKFTFYAADGSHVESVMIGEGMDSCDKASNKAMAIAHKYALLQLLAIPTEDAKDPDAESHSVAPRQQAAPRQESAPPASKPLSASNPIGKTPEQGMKERSLDIIKQLGIKGAEAEALFVAHGGVGVVHDGKKGWQGIDWSGVLNELVERQRGTIDEDAAEQLSRVFDGVLA